MASSSLCKMTAAMAACIVLLALVLPPCSGCSEVGRSKTFKGDCFSDGGCVDACRSEGYEDGYCFGKVFPDHPICICTARCPPPPATTTSS
ncbi:hypothetical protein GUJ93_ZPchr0006g41119 [Zizania palustris]|uniref:Knottins-like domain-containing protein n=1 Tax=Zizania palustris TaxID=103762 RepID=A0A8J5W292_ZIZPA|nr:hypothetical protein GUJ93_ZPchr0006g41119 [Zizania palustris]